MVTPADRVSTVPVISMLPRPSPVTTPVVSTDAMDASPVDQSMAPAVTAKPLASSGSPTS